MATAKRTPNNRSTKPVGVRLNEAELKKLDAQRSQLGGVSRAGALKHLWSVLGDAAVERFLEQQSVSASDRRDLQPIIGALNGATKAWQDLAHQRQMVGANMNQVARFVNLLRLRVREGEGFDEDALDRIELCLNGIHRSVEQQLAAEASDDLVLARFRAWLDEDRAKR